jgi:two-component system, chemotaxis family, protein-glutamate methylesterase/glutaminase
MKNRIIVIGASAGGIQAIARILNDLPAGFAAPVLVVQHLGRRVPSYLPEILARTTLLPVSHPHDGELIEPGRVYVAPPDRHMLVRSGAIRLSCGPEENYARPAIDVLFRSAAIAYGSRVVGVVLTGYLCDGAAGLLAIKALGGVSIVQDPDEASIPSMPLAALAKAPVDYRRSLPEIGPLLIDLVADPPSEDRHGPTSMELENRIAGELGTDGDLRELLRRGTPTPLVCPMCSTTLHRLDDARLQRYRCGSGHAFSECNLVAGARGASDGARYWLDLEQRGPSAPRIP